MKEDIWKHIFINILIFFASLGVFLIIVSSFFTNIWLGIFGIAICVVIKVFSTLWNKKRGEEDDKKRND